MQSNNVKLMVAAAVVIVLCLLFSWVYTDEGAPAEMREAEVGDATTYIYIMTDADGNETRINGIDTVVSEYADGCQQIETEYGDGTKEYWETEGNYSGQPIAGTLTGQETVYSPYFGNVACDVYHDESTGSTVWCVEGTETFVKDVHVEDGKTVTRFLYDSTLFGERPSFGSSEEAETLEAGDYYAYKYWEYDSEGSVVVRDTLVNMVYAVDGDMVTYGWLDSGDTNTTTVDEFIDHLHFSSMSDSLGTDVVVNDSYGERLCEVYEITDGDAVEIYYIGVDDGICYRCDYYYPDYSQRFDLIYSTFVTGDMDFEVPDLRQEIVEEDEYGMLIITRTDGVWDTYRVTYFVDRVYDDHLSMGYYVNGKRAGTVEGDLFIEMDMDYEVIGTETLATPWGLLETEVQVSTLEDGVKVTNWMLPGYDLAVASMYEYPEGDLYISIFVECTLFFESPDYGCLSTVAVADVGVGDSKTYSLLALTSEGGYEFRDVVVSVTSVDSDGLVLECDGQTYESTVDGYLWADTTGYAYVESRVTSTPFGDRYTDIYQKDIEGGIEQLIVGHDDGVMYFLYQETEDSMLSLMLLGGTDFY